MGAFCDYAFFSYSNFASKALLISCSCLIAVDSTNQFNPTNDHGHTSSRVGVAVARLVLKVIVTFLCSEPSIRATVSVTAPPLSATVYSVCWNPIVTPVEGRYQCVFRVVTT